MAEAKRIGKTLAVFSWYVMVSCEDSCALLASLTSKQTPQIVNENPTVLKIKISLLFLQDNKVDGKVLLETTSQHLGKYH